MAAPFWLYGSSPDALAQQQRGYEQLFTNTAEANRNAAHSAAATSLQAFLQSQAADDQARQFDARNRIAAMEEARRSDVANRVEAENTRRFNLDFGMRKDAAMRAEDFNRRFGIPGAQADLELKRAQVQNLKENNPTALKQIQFAHGRAAEDADAGAINSIQEAMNLYPGLTRIEAENYFNKSQQARNEIESQVGKLESAARTLTMYEQAKRERDAALAEKPTGGFLGMGTNKDELVKKQQDSAAKFATIEQAALAIQNPKLGIINQLEFDPDTVTWRAVVPKLPWSRSGNANQPASTPAFFGNPQTQTGTFPGPAPTEAGKRFTIQVKSSPTPAASVVPPNLEMPAPVDNTVRSPSPAFLSAPVGAQAPVQSPQNAATRPASTTAFGGPAITEPAFWSNNGKDAANMLNELAYTITPRYSGERSTYLTQPVSSEQNIPAPTMQEIALAHERTRRRTQLLEELRRTPTYDRRRIAMWNEYLSLLGNR